MIPAGWARHLFCGWGILTDELLALVTALARMRRAVGAMVLLCVAMITAMPVLAITVGDECEKACCKRKASGHACCKRGKSPAGMAFTALQARCCAGNANVGLARLGVGFSAEQGVALVVGLVGVGDVRVVDAVRADVVLAGHALFERPPPVL